MRQTKTNLDTLDEIIIDVAWNIDAKRTLSENRSGFTRFRILHKRPPKGDSGVDGRLTIIPVTSRLETIGLEVLSSISKCAQKESHAVGH